MNENVRIAVRDSLDRQTLTFLDNSATGTLHYTNDTLNRFVEGDASVLTIDVAKTHEDVQYLTCGNKLAFIWKNKDYWMNIIDVEENEYQLTVIAFSLSLELNNETRGEYNSDGAMSIEQYIRKFDPERTLTIGLNEVSDKKISYEWTGTQTVLARLYSIANVFSAEFEFVTKLNDDYSLNSITLNIYRKHSDTSQGIGENKTNVTLRFGKEIKTITRKENIKEIYTGIRPRGKDGLNLVGYIKKEYDKNNLLEYYTDGDLIRAPQARDRFPSFAAQTTDMYITYDWETEYSTQEALYGAALAELKKHCVPELEFTVDGYFDTNVGDTLTIENNKYKPILIIEARVTEQIESFTDPSKNKTTFSNFKEIGSQIDSSLLAKVQQLIDANKKYEYQMISDNGTVFKNGEGQTTLKARVLDGVEDITNSLYVVWYKDGQHLVDAQSITVKAADINEKAVYRYIATNVSGSNSGGFEVTVTNVDDGKGGRGVVSTVITYQKSTSGTTVPIGTWSSSIPSIAAGEYLWTRTIFSYTDTTTSTAYSVGRMGVNGSPGKDGTDGVGVKQVDVHYQAGSSGTSAPTGTWTTTVPSVSANQYLWTRTTTTYTDNSTSIAYSVGKMGANGSDAKLLYLSATAETMNFNPDNTPKNTTITISAKLQNVTGTATFKAIPYIGTTAQSEIALGGSGNDRTLTSAQWSNKQWDFIAITATLSGLTDTLSIVKVTDGEDGTDGINGSGQLLFNPNWENYNSSGNTSTMGWTYNAYAKRLAAESDNPTLPIMRIGEGSTASRYIRSVNIPVVPDTYIRIQGEARFSTVTVNTGYFSVVRFYEAGKAAENETQLAGANSYFQLNNVSNGSLVKDVVTTPASNTTVANVWTPFTHTIKVPAGVSNMKWFAWNGQAVATAYTDFRGVSITTYKEGEKGDPGIIYSDAEPNPKEKNMMWQKPGEPLKRWNGATWVIHQFMADNIYATNLTVTDGKFEKLEGTEIHGSLFKNTFSNYSSVQDAMSGYTQIQGATVESRYTGDTTGLEGYWSLTPTGYSMGMKQKNGNSNGIDLYYDRLVLRQNSDYVVLDYATMRDSGWITIPWARTGVSGTLQYRYYLGTFTCRLIDFVFNGTTSSASPLARIPSSVFVPTASQMHLIPLWNNSGTTDTIQVNADGGIHKVSNNGGTTMARASFVVF
ncbi:phage tail protein [Candidatus Enterococcus clewellii]|uniref:Tail spike domain-containing protein n=1 Tax=Candidatus Enterococcus clewellii TaxID=1834193 RepID=A0A242K808_9ENTE|nr:phage tail protein [Enterococcus sp. 9E7_DIV0242]OTP17301.1 hypothetical protein A5888_001439 [Enterococcus sp. 9E7_DIV0242]